MAFSIVALLALTVPFISAQRIRGEGNLTIGFFADDRESTCQDDPWKGLTLTTSSIPTTFTCFNVSDVFSMNKTSGFQNATQTVYDYNGDIIQPNGISWRLENQNQFSSKANYSHIWYQQVNMSQSEPNEDGTWVLYIYAFDDCRQISHDKTVDDDDFPWFQSSCQTEPGGQCRTVPYSIKSFGILSASEYNERRDKCDEWAYMGAAPAMHPLFYLTSIVSLLAGVFLAL